MKYFIVSTLIMLISCSIQKNCIDNFFNKKIWQVDEGFNSYLFFHLKNDMILIKNYNPTSKEVSAWDLGWVRYNSAQDVVIINGNSYDYQCNVDRLILNSEVANENITVREAEYNSEKSLKGKWSFLPDTSQVNHAFKFFENGMIDLTDETFLKGGDSYNVFYIGDDDILLEVNGDVEIISLKERISEEIYKARVVYGKSNFSFYIKKILE